MCVCLGEGIPFLKCVNASSALVLYLLIETVDI